MPAFDLSRCTHLPRPGGKCNAGDDSVGEIRWIALKKSCSVPAPFLVTLILVTAYMLNAVATNNFVSVVCLTIFVIVRKRGQLSREVFVV